MKLGLIGHPLSHSWSPQIHRFFLGEAYELIDLKPEELETFLKDRDFDGVNVTIPYKTAVMQYLDEIDPAAREIGAVNCIVNRNGRLKGFNTDYLGFRDMLVNAGMEISGKRTAVLGSGGASKAVFRALRDLGAQVSVVSRTPHDDLISYEELYRGSFEVIVNTTPVGMYPKISDMPADLNRLECAETVIDVIANPVRSAFLFAAGMRGCRTLGGLEMLVRQAFAAGELFTGRTLDRDLIEPCIRMLLRQKQNIVLIGMPTSGKTTLGALLSEATGKQLVEMDELTEKHMGMSIPRAFAEHGEAFFREAERRTVSEIALYEHSVISCGGGVIKDPENMKKLAANGLIVWLDRRPDLLYGSSDRPLSPDYESVLKLYQERYGIYESFADIRITNNDTIEDCLNRILLQTGEHDGNGESV